MTPDAYVASGKHLPPCLRDFSDQTEIFRAMHGLMDLSGDGYGRNTDQVEGQCYVIDLFLWFMAKRGYTLQRSRAKVDFRDLGEDVQGYVGRQHDLFMAALKEGFDRGKAKAAEPGGDTERTDS